MVTAKLLQMFNSAVFGLANPVTNPTQAVLVIGAERLKALVLMAHVFTAFERERCPGFSPETVWLHSLECASNAEAIINRQTKDIQLAGLGFTAGLMHDVGKLLLAANLPKEYAEIHIRARKENRQLHEVELEVLKTTHAEVASCVFGFWALPLPLLEAILWHHNPMTSWSKDFSVLSAVYFGNAFVHEKRMQGKNAENDCHFDVDYLHLIKKFDERNHWRAACGLAPHLT